MFSLNRRFPLIRKAIIVIFAVPLMFAGGSFLGGLAQDQSVGEVGSLDIPRTEYETRFRRAVEQYRRASGTEELSQGVINQINQQVRSQLLSYYLFQAAVEQKGLQAPDRAVASAIRENPQFQDEEGNFDPGLYNSYVSDRRSYQEQVRDSISREPVFRAMQALPLEALRDKLAVFRRQERVADEAVVAVTALDTGTVAIDIPADDINLYYQQNRNDYRLSEEADFEYFIFSLDSFAAGYTVSVDDTRAAYADYTAEADERARWQVSHIYLNDQALAEEVYAEAAADTARFGELARQYSEDAGSADVGGSLGIVTDGDLPLEMGQVLRTLVEGEVAEPLLLEDGAYSILKLDARISDPLPAFDEVRDEMMRRAQQEKAADDFAAEVELLREMAPVEIGSLAVMASLAATSVSLRATVYREAADNAYPFDSDVVLPDVFDPLVVESGENSDAIALEDGSYLFVRSRRYQPEGFQSLDEVQRDIEETLYAGYLVQDLYRQLAGITVTGTLANPAAGRVIDVQTLLDSVEWQPPQTLVLADAEEDALNSIDGNSIDNEGSEPGQEDYIIDRVFSVDLSDGLPAYAFIPEAYQVKIFRIRDIIEGEPQERDYLAIDELTSDMSLRLSNLGYLDELIGEYDYQFYSQTPTQVPAQPSL